ncbi:J domain-containing protein [Mycetocola zhujimingii]|uniref:J domain-containing protein n=1 Tax=Mycetocola zhujimingii TaxID=2079792 RepID=A0A2U1TB09_9MICO|nr:DnaJ domain-containing protein [Mycetocola zhujimingii]PWC06071.1 hypothetical protein DF223_13670 [Mycetocola zhujimingii]
MSRETHYDVLGAPRTSTPAELKLAYRRALRTSHPDVGGSAESFRLVQAAWDVLGNSARRAEYDRLYMPQASAPPPHSTSAPPQGSTRRERSSSRRASEQPGSPSGAKATPTFATSHGHPGGSARLRYLDTTREWILSPRPPQGPSKPPRIRHEQDRFLHMWGVVCLQLFLSFAAIVAVFATVAAVTGNLPAIPSYALFPVIRQVALNIFSVAFLCGGVIATMRLVTSPSRAEVREVRAHNRRIYVAMRKQFVADLGNRPSEPGPFLQAPFAAESVRMAPTHARFYLERALAQESIAAALKSLSAEFTMWHDVHLGDARVYVSHLVVGPQGLFLVEPLLERPRIDAEHIDRVAAAIGVAGVSGVLFVDVDASAVNAPPAKLGEWPAHAWRLGTARLAPLLGGGIHGLERGEPWEMRQLVERVGRRAMAA